MDHHRSHEALEAEFAAVAKAAGGEASASATLTLLCIGDEHVGVLSGRGAKLEEVKWLEIGPARVTSQYFHHDPPKSQEIERAIDFVEDEIMRLGRPEQAISLLWSTSSALRAWSAVAGPHMSIETVEAWFQKLASVSLGQPGALAGLPAGREAAAVLLVLREFMHHRGHASITVLNPPGDIGQ